MAPEKRVLVNVVFNSGWMTGMCILPLAAYLTRSWVLLGIFSSICTASVLLFWKYVPESASWLVSQDRYSDATNVMMLIGKRNGKNIEEKTLSMKLKNTKEEEAKEDKSFFSFMLKHPRLRKHFLILTFSWTANTLAYLGFQYNVVHLAGNVFVNYFLLSLVEAPGNALFWYSMEKIGRRWSATIGFFTIALCCLLPLSGVEYSDVASSIIGKLITSGLFMNVDQQGCELFPTVARSLGVGTGKSISMIIVLFTPFVAYLSNYGKIIPFLIIGSVCLLASVLSSFLPETLSKNLPQSYSDAENFGLDQEYFSFNRKKKPVPEATVYAIEVKDPNIIYSIRL
nr:organic cation transporter 1-like isoform X1 [Parasteatoda tepidariorum]